MDPDELSIIFYLREKLRIPQVKKKSQTGVIQNTSKVYSLFDSVVVVAFQSVFLCRNTSK
jgi:hypothetical protein